MRTTPAHQRSGAWGKRIVIAVTAVLLVILGTVAWVVPRVERDLTAATLADLDAAGIDTTGLEVDFRYRSGRISGTLAPGVTASDLRRAIDVEGIRGLAIDVTSVSEPEPPAEPEPTEPEPEPAEPEPAEPEPAEPEPAEPEPAEPEPEPAEPEPEPEPAEPEPEPSEPELGQTLASIGPVLFDTASEDLRPDQADRLTQLATEVSAALDRDPTLVLAITGHADSRGSTSYNQLLSERRAASVVAYLVEQGNDPSRFSVSGRSELEPIAPNTTPEGLQSNRRVEIGVAEPPPSSPSTTLPPTPRVHVSWSP